MKRKRKRKKLSNFDKALANAKRDAAKLEPWKQAFIQQIDRQGTHQ